MMKKRRRPCENCSRSNTPSPTRSSPAAAGSIVRPGAGGFNGLGNVVIGRKVHKCQDKEGGGRDGVEPAGQHTNDEVAEAAHHDSSGRSPVYQSGVSSSTEPAFVVFEDQCGADATTGQAISAFVILRGEFSAEPALEIDLRDHVAKLISPIAKPAEVVMLPELPKTRSGKIMRRLLKDLAEGTELGDVTTLADVSIVETITKEIADRR